MKPKLYNLPSYKTNTGCPRMLRIILYEKLTRIDFGHQTDSFYIRGGWVNIHPETFIRIHHSKEKLQMLKAENIPVKPDKHHFRSTVDNLYFTLYFPPLPDRYLSFDLIEDEPATTTLFNYYNIRINKAKAIELLNKI
ncbi:MAG TPA: hypothetical protein PKW80_04475 [Bacteroidales bacterium]|nr:hypothetical protein [Bacteroidales bacterium]